MRIYLSILFVLLFFMHANGVRAEDVPESSWQGAIEQLNKIGGNDVDFCQKRWGILWPLAKQGSADAWAQLFLDMMIYERLLPGSTADSATRLRDMLVLAVHGAGSTDELYLDSVRAALVPFEGWPASAFQKFSKCMKGSDRDSCAEAAVAENLVPSFNAFSVQIDAALRNGKMSVCQSKGHNLLEQKN